MLIHFVKYNNKNHQTHTCICKSNNKCVSKKLFQWNIQSNLINIVEINYNKTVKKCIKAQFIWTKLKQTIVVHFCIVFINQNTVLSFSLTTLPTHTSTHSVHKLQNSHFWYSVIDLPTKQINYLELQIISRHWKLNGN